MAPVHAAAQSATFVAPPRTIADITAILDQEKPDPAAARKLRAAAEAVPPVGASRPTLAKFHFDRSEARVRLGDYRGALADAQLALDIGEGAVTPREIEGIRRHVALIYLSMGDPKNALEVFLSIAQTAKGPELKGFLFNTYRHITGLYSLFGRFDEAEAYLRKAEALLEEARSWPSYRGYFRLIWEGEVETARAGFYEARGQFAQAESALRQAESLRREAVLLPEWPPTVPPRYIIERVADIMLAALGRVKAQQGRMAEGEADVRRALLNQLKTFGKYNLLTQKLIWIFANLLLEQGRYIEAEKLTRTQIEVLQALGIPSDSQQLAKMWNALAANLTLQERWQDAAQVYAELDAATRLWEPERKSSLNLSTARIDAFYNTGDLSAGIAMAERLLLQQASLFGEQHLETALARGMLAVGLARAGRDADAWREFRAAVPVLISASRGIDLDDSTDIVARERRIQMVVESYMELLARGGAPDAAGDSFRLADAIRGRAVQAALNASSMRWAAKNPATAELIRRSQDLEKQIAARLGLLNNLLALPSEQRDDNAVNALQGEIESMRSAREAADREIAAKFPDYLNLMASQAPDAKDIQNVLGADEAFLSIYLGRDASFVWAIAKTGPSAFISVPVGRSEIDRKVLKLREALEPTGVTVGEIPAFDLALAHEIYSLLLKPVELTWGAAKNLIVVTNGALGLLPLGLLPTAPATVASDAAPLFAGYRSVPWLARTHAVSMVPSAGALTTLRRLPPGAPSREQLIGFGDPFFSAEEASQAQAGQAPKPVEVAARGLPLKRRAKVRTSEVDSAELAALPRLPDTADELKSIALALQADPTKVVHLGRDANERTIKTSALERYRVVAFATHGLVPGDLNGLTQPALALTAPEIADVDGDGLLTMDEILGLKLDADWVVLSACNTAAGAAAGAEAASGLGRAFFYAGARALLVTNWSVYSDAARALVSDLFRRQTAEAQLSRGEALRQAMMALLDGPGYTDASGKTLFTYGHPIFWAPYTLIGDNGR